MKLNKIEIQNQLASLSSDLWTIVDNELQSNLTFSNFPETIDFVNKIIIPAEEAQHHPDLVISYNKLKIILTTHDENGLTIKDFDLAKIITNLYSKY